MQFNSCRLCQDPSQDLRKYGVRHYAHAKCGFKKWGDAFLDRLPIHEVKNLPVKVCYENGWTIKSLTLYCKTREAANEWANAVTIKANEFK